MNKPKDLKFEDLPLFLSPKEYAEFTGEHLNTVYKKLNNGEIPGDKKGGTWTICRDAAWPNATREVIGNGI